jgi:16S rRNA (guanine527-N7)-methyltransferase
MEVEDRAGIALASLAAQYGLGRRQHEQLAALLEVLAHDRRAPTSVRRPERAVDVHIADSLAALELEMVRSAAAIADIGTGAGFPGLVLAVAVSGSEVRLLESQARKCLFLREVIARIGVENARVQCVRAEEWHEGAERHDLVVARAVGPAPVALEYAAPLLRLGGTFLDWRGRRARDEELAAERAAGELGLGLVEVRPVAPFQGARDHHLHVYVKVRETPARFPRRAGMARKRPIGS